MFLPEFLLSFFLYFLFMFLFFNFNSLFLFWILLELNMIFFIMLIKMSFFLTKEKFEPSSELLYYFLVQSIGSFILVMFSFSSNFYSFYMLDYFIIISILIKSGFIPFHIWVYKMSPSANWFVFFLLITVQKIPFIFFFTYNLNFLTLTLILINLILGSFFLLNSHFSYINVIISSSMYTLFWLVNFLLFSIYIFAQLFLFYCVSCFLLLKTWTLSYLNSPSFNSLIMSGLFFIGLPPFSLFFSKFYTSLFIMNFSTFTLFFTIWLATFVSIIGYFKFFYKIFLIQTSIQLMSQKKFFLFNSMSIALIFLLF